MEELDGLIWDAIQTLRKIHPQLIEDKLCKFLAADNEQLTKEQLKEKLI